MTTKRTVSALRIAGALAAPALMLALGGAVRSPYDAATSSGVCDLVTRAEAAAALGSAVPAGKETIMDLPLLGATVKAEFCFFGSEVAVARYALGDDAKALFGKYRESLASREDYQSVGEIGDEAFLAKGQLAVRKGETGLIVDVGQARGGWKPEEAAEKKLAIGALARF